MSAGRLHRARKTPDTISSETTTGETPVCASFVGASAAPSHAPAVRPEAMPTHCSFRSRDGSIPVEAAGLAVAELIGSTAERPVLPAAPAAESKNARPQESPATTCEKIFPFVVTCLCQSGFGRQRRLRFYTGMAKARSPKANLRTILADHYPSPRFASFRAFARIFPALGRIRNFSTGVVESLSFGESSWPKTFPAAINPSARSLPGRAQPTSGIATA